MSSLTTADLEVLIEDTRSIPDGATLRFWYSYGAGDGSGPALDEYQFVALWVGTRWFLSGNTDEPSKRQTHAEMMEMLASDRVREAQLSVAWVDVKL